MASFLDNLQAQSQTWLTNFAPQILESGLKSTGLIKVAAPPTSNLTAAQMGSGQTGSINGMGLAPSGMPAWLLPVIAIVAVVGIIFAVKRRK